MMREKWSGAADSLRIADRRPGNAESETRTTESPHHSLLRFEGLPHSVIHGVLCGTFAFFAP